MSAEGIRIAIDVVNQRAGGGLQVATTFLESLPDGQSIELVCLQGSKLAALGYQRGWSITERADTRLARAWRNFGPRRVVNRGVRADVTYTIFGPPLRGSHVGTTVTGVAYSNLFYPEVDFWRAEPLARRVARWARDRMRLRALLSADALIFETEATKDRAHGMYPKLRGRPTLVCPPSPRPGFFRDAVDYEANDPPRVLLAASWHPNKNLHMLPRVARALCERGAPATFVLTLEPGSAGANSIAAQAAALDVAGSFEFIGRVPSDGMPATVADSDVMMLISELESFSNNVIEAFAARVPLVISDRDWAKSVCRDAAAYCEPTVEDSIADAILDATSGPMRRRELVEKGSTVLNEGFLDPLERSNVVLKFCIDAAVRSEGNR